MSVNLAVDIIARRIEALGLADAARGTHRAILRRARPTSCQLPTSNLIRTAYFCSGCPHNTSTRTIEGSMAFTGVGCYGLVPMLMPDRKTEWAAQMGAEGTLWVGLQSFVDVPHAFQNLGDGTYFHSGILAVRQAVAAKANMTYKLLYNDAVAMTGGQPIDGQLSVEDMANQLYWEGVRPIVIVTDEPEKYPATVRWPKGTTIRHRKELELVQKDLQQVKGVSALIYDQTCAAEKRRRRKRGTFPNPQKRVFINQDVCEGCGDCNKKSNCVSVQPLDTEFGRKRKIDQSSCNKDYSCLDGFCPSFVTVLGGAPRKGEAANTARSCSAIFAALPAPAAVPLTDAYNVLITGIGGTGVLTVGAILGMAAHLDGKACSVMDITGMAQKGGSVVTHLRFGASRDKLFATRLWENSADLVIGCDLVVTTSAGDARSGPQRQRRGSSSTATWCRPRSSRPTRRIDLSQERLLGVLATACDRASACSPIAATSSAVRLMGDSIATNVFMLGYALQKGLHADRTRGDRAGDQPQRRGDRAEPARAQLGPARGARPAALSRRCWRRLDGRRGRRGAALADVRAAASSAASRHLTAYQDANYARRYTEFVEKVRQVENARVPGSTAVTQAVATLALEADELQGRVRGGAAVHQRRFPAASQAAVRRQLPAQLPSVAADLQSARQGDRQADARSASARGC